MGARHPLITPADAAPETRAIHMLEKTNPLPGAETEYVQRLCEILQQGRERARRRVAL